MYHVCPFYDLTTSSVLVLVVGGGSLTAQSTHGPYAVQFQPEAASVPPPPRPVQLGAFLVGQSPLQQVQPGGLRLRLSPLGQLVCFGGGHGGLLLRVAVQHVLQVVQGQKLIVAFQKLLHQLQKEEAKGMKLLGRVQGRITQSRIHFITLCSDSFLLPLPALSNFLQFPPLSAPPSTRTCAASEG